jgi:hypothetical protein
MKRLFAVACLLCSLAATADPAKVTVLDGDDVAQRIVAISVGADVAAGDARVVQARAWLDRATKVYGEDAKSVAASCERSARWFFDITRSRASALEMLEALALLAKPGLPMQDAMRNYIEARRAVAGKSHAEALAKLGVGGK